MRERKRKFIKDDLSEYRGALVRAFKRKIRAVARDIHEGIFGDDTYIPISDINLDARGVLIYSTSWCMLRASIL